MRNNEVRIEITSSLEDILKEFLMKKGKGELIVRTHNGYPVTITTYTGRDVGRYDGYNLNFAFKGVQQCIEIDKERGSKEAIDRLHPYKVLPQFYIAVKVKLENKFETFLSEKQTQTQTQE